MEKVLKQLVEKLERAFGDGLISTVLYGSAAVGDYHDRYSDINILCVLREITPAELRECEPIFTWWRELGNPSPLLLTEFEVKTSTDCFPIEFHDIKERRRILQGTDVVADLEIDDKYYRAQVEHELRAKLLRLRQKSAGILSEKDVLARLLAESVSTFCILARHALRLTGIEPGWQKRDIVGHAVEGFGIDPAPFTTLLDLREERIKPKSVDSVSLLEQYLKEIQRVIEAVDRIGQ
ncbi:MAG: hypothetical protein ACK5AZ_09625 [Bryobacteraceae bacterium]